MDEMKAFKSLMFFLMVFLLATYQSCSELRLSAFGHPAEGRVSQVLAEVDGGTREATGRYKIEYNYRTQKTDGGQTLAGMYLTSKQDAEERNEVKTCEVLYLPDKPYIHRVKGHGRIWWVVAFFVMLGVIVANLLVIIRQARQDVARYGGRSSRP